MSKLKTAKSLIFHLALSGFLESAIGSSPKPFQVGLSFLPEAVGATGSRNRRAA